MVRILLALYMLMCVGCTAASTRITVTMVHDSPSVTIEFDKIEPNW